MAKEALYAVMDVDKKENGNHPQAVCRRMEEAQVGLAAQNSLKRDLSVLNPAYERGHSAGAAAINLLLESIRAFLHLLLRFRGGGFSICLRLAQEEAEHPLQQQKSKKRRLHQEKDTVTSEDASVVSPSLNLSSMKDGSDRADIELSHRVDENLLRDGGEVSNNHSVVDHLLHVLFQHGDSADKYMQGSRSIKIDNWILLDNFVQKSRISVAACSHALHPHSKRSKRHMSLEQHKKCGSIHLPQVLHNFELFEPMHEMWTSYISQLLKHVGKNQFAQCLLNADLHGSVIRVATCLEDNVCLMHW
ncbi:hypothetical protein ACH5RR_005421 [Cinchona calisaya]|uniref:Uncharacterized protein n=1 Tax=Cinchona calisaya TaxID=153742 RepID=A0ABD3AL52_9GENT